MSAGGQIITEARKPVPLCKYCGKKCKPNFDHACKDCGHQWFMHTMLSGGHCAGENKTCSCQVKGVHWKDNPTQFTKKLRGYGILSVDLFCKEGCAVMWAIRTLLNSERAA